MVCHRKDLRMGEVRNSDLEWPRSKKSNYLHGYYASADANFSERLPKNLKEWTIIWGLEMDFLTL